LPDPPAVANGIVFVLSTGENENPMQTTGAKVIYTNQKLLTEEQREAPTHNVALYPSWCSGRDSLSGFGE
jgi:hypothetical protein